ncbi:MAG: hypothetical protein H6742_13685 [Alphaproteobacteria bacterium]|nr:hypothetical protein [Alphaproteobacteria bacterium]
MTQRRFQHPIPAHRFSDWEDECLQHLVNFHSIRDLAVQRRQAGVLGDFAAVALRLTYLSWLRGAAPERVAAFAGDTVAITAWAAGNGHLFARPYEYWLLTCLAVAIDHPAAGRLAALRPEQWSKTPHALVVGMLPPAMGALASLVGSGRPPEFELRGLQVLHRELLGKADHREEAMRFAPTVGAMIAIQANSRKTWDAAFQARADGWRQEAIAFPETLMFVLDIEWLAMMRLAREAGLRLAEPDPYRPHHLLGSSSGDEGTLGDRLGPAS